MNKKKLFIYLHMVCATMPLSRQLWTIGLSFTPSASSLHAETSIDTDVVISGPEHGLQKHSFRNMGEFDLKINYDPDSLSFDAYMLKDRRNNPDDERYLSFPGGCRIRLSDISCLCHFSFRSPHTHSLTKLSLFGSGMKCGELSFSDGIMDDGCGIFSLSMGNCAADVSEQPRTTESFSLNSGLADIVRSLNRGFVRMKGFNGFFQPAEALNS